MQIKITPSNVEIFRTHNNYWDTLWTHNKTLQYGKVGIFWLKTNGNIYGGWLSFPLSSSVIHEMEIWSYTKRRIGAETLLELFVNSEEQLNILAYQFMEHQQKWNLPGKLPEKPLYYDTIVEVNTKVDTFMEEISSWIQKAKESLSFQEIDQINFGDYQRNFQLYEGFLRFEEHPSKFKSKFNFSQKYQQLDKLKRNFQPKEMKQLAVSRELIHYIQDYQQRKKSFDAGKGKFTADEIQTRINQTRNNHTNFQQFQQQNARYYQKSPELGQQVNEINKGYNDLIQLLNIDYNHVRKKEEIKLRTLKQDQAILEQLKQFTPGLQTLLTRISELTQIDKKLVEQSINRLLDESSDLGTYDSLSQVFIPGSEISKLIDELIAKFDEDPIYKKKI